MVFRGKRTQFDAAKLSAIWVLASKDQNYIISYPGLYYRLTQNSSFKGKRDLESIKDEVGYRELQELVHSRRELFRPGAPQTALDMWKKKLGKWKDEGSTSYPDWLREIENDTIERNIINSLQRKDVCCTPGCLRLHSATSWVSVCDPA